jgi:hypothetical protein
MESKSSSQTPFEKFLAFTKKVVAVPKAEIDKREAEYQRERKKLRKQRHRQAQ